MLNEWFFPGRNLEKNYINICSGNNSSDFHYISLHHRHHDVTGTSSCFLKNPALFGVYQYLYSGKQVNFISVYQDKQIYMQDIRI